MKLLLSVSFFTLATTVAHAGPGSKAAKMGLREMIPSTSKYASRTYMGLRGSGTDGKIYRTSPRAKKYFSTSLGKEGGSQSESEEVMSQTMKKKLQVVDIGKKDYKFDPKTSMYYYEDEGTKELEGSKKPELKEFDTFVEFDVKKK